MNALEYLALAEAVLIDGPQGSSIWAAVEFIRKARQRLPADPKYPSTTPSPDPLDHV